VLRGLCYNLSAYTVGGGLRVQYLGFTTTGSPATDLFPLRSTGVTTEPVRQAAAAFLAALTPDQRTRTAFGVDDPE
jgi:hypothetical protein